MESTYHSQLDNPIIDLYEESKFIKGSLFDLGQVLRDLVAKPAGAQVFYKQQLFKYLEDVDVKFPKPLVTSTLSEKHIEAERQVKEVRWKKEKMQDDIQREQALLNHAKFNFDKKQEFLKFLAESSSHATLAAPVTPR